MNRTFDECVITRILNEVSGLKVWDSPKRDAGKNFANESGILPVVKFAGASVVAGVDDILV